MTHRTSSLLLLVPLLAGCGNISDPVEDACDFLTDQLLNAEIAIFQQARDLGQSRANALAEFSIGCEIGCRESLPDAPITVIASCVTLCIGCGDAIADLVYGPN